MEFRNVQGLSIFVALMLATGAFARAPKATPLQTTYVNVTCKIFVTEAGIPKTAEVLAVKPTLAPAAQASIEKSVSQSVLTWEFKPNQENGRPVAGYIVVPVHIDLADPVPASGT
jgi:hypothetical protein